MSVFNRRLADSEKQLALDYLEDRNGTFVQTMRSVAKIKAQQNGEVTTDDLREWIEEYGIKKGLPEPTSMNAMGTIFRGKEWVFVRFTKSRLVQGHGNLIRVWRLKDAC